MSREYKIEYENYHSKLEQKKEELFRKQILTSSEWCKRYGVKINYQSKFLNSYTLFTKVHF